MENQWTIPLTDSQRRHGPNTPPYQQGEDATTQNCACLWCSGVQRTQAPTTWYPAGQQDPRHFGNADTPYLNQDQNVNNRVPYRGGAPQTARIQDNNFGYAPVHERAGPSNMGLAQAPTLDTSIEESRRRLASRYLNNPDAYVSTIRLEPGPSGELQVIITLGIANVL